MENVDTASLVYLSLLAAALIFMVFVRGRQSLARASRHLAIWALIFVGAIAVAGLWSDIRTSVAPRQSIIAETGQIVLPRGPDGHYYATLSVNGEPVRFVVDTGATGIVLSRDDARRAGITDDMLAFVSRAQTANGIVETAPVTLSTLALGPYTDRSVQAFVNGGDLNGSLLGMSYLQRFNRVEITGGEMMLSR